MLKKENGSGEDLRKQTLDYVLSYNHPESIFQLEQVLQSILNCCSIHSPEGALEHLVHVLQRSEGAPKQPSTNYTTGS